jgi:predicted component of type VI protein secretion system
MSIVKSLKLNFEPQNQMEQKEQVRKISDSREELMGKLTENFGKVDTQSANLSNLIRERKLLVQIMAHTDLLMQLQAVQNTEEFWASH